MKYTEPELRVADGGCGKGNKGNNNGGAELSAEVVAPAAPTVAPVVSLNEKDCTQVTHHHCVLLWVERAHLRLLV